MVNSKSAAILLGWCIAQQTASAFIPSTAMNGKNAQWTQLSASSNDDSNMDSMSRRELWTKTSAAAAAAFSVALNPNAAFAATKPPTEADLARIKKGYDGIEYLLANWEKETTVCRVGISLLLCLLDCFTPFTKIYCFHRVHMKSF